jgi:hypothetical protein
MEETNPRLNENTTPESVESISENQSTTHPLPEEVLQAEPLNSMQSLNPEEESAEIMITPEILDAEVKLNENKEEEIATESYAHLTKVELLDKLKNLAQTDEEGSSWQEVRNIKMAFSELQRDEHEQKLQAFLAEGGERADFKIEKDEIDAVFVEFFKGFDQRRQELKRKKDALMAENAEKKLHIIESLKQLAENANSGNMPIKGIFDQLHQLQEQWRLVGPAAAADNRAAGDAYRYACEKVYEYIQIDKELRELNYKKNLKVKKELCEKAEKLILEPSIRVAVDGIKLLQEEWKEAGTVSREMNEVIWERFRKAADQVYARLKEYVESIRSKEDTNKTGKTNLIQQLEALISQFPDNNAAWQKMTEEVEVMMTAWKQLGFASKKDNEELWNQFKNLRETFFKAKEAHFDQIKKIHQDNYRIKNDLCMKAEEVKDSSDWKKTTDLILNLQKRWKATGPVNYKQSEKIWQRFRAACDHFFERKKANFADQDATYAANLTAKIELIQQIEAYQRVSDNNINFETLKNFQNQWMSIGHVPIKEKEKLNNAYRKAVDAHFDAMRTGNFERNKENYKNKIEQMSSRPDANNKVNEELFQLQDKIRKKEHEASLLDNNIGFFGNSKGADALLKDTKKKIELLRNDIKLLKEQLKMLRAINSVEQEKK